MARDHLVQMVKARLVRMVMLQQVNHLNALQELQFALMDQAQNVMMDLNHHHQINKEVLKVNKEVLKVNQEALVGSHPVKVVKKVLEERVVKVEVHVPTIQNQLVQIPNNLLAQTEAHQLKDKVDQLAPT